ncbi:MAG: amino acid adenylation domain-containing protein, partial [Acidobacteriaceae bacterium]
MDHPVPKVGLTFTCQREHEREPGFLYEYPLTPGQAALWFHHKLTPQSVAYNQASTVAVKADTDLEALWRAFQHVAERHPMLRTLFAEEHGKPVQRVYSSVKGVFRVVDASKWDPDQLNAHLAEEVYRPFDLERGPVWRIIVFQQPPISTINPGNKRPLEHLVLLVLHHILVDMWSFAILMSEVAALYRQETTGLPASLRPLRANYADHVQKEIQRLSEPQAEISWNYWRAALSGELPPLSLQTDRPRPPDTIGHAAAHSIFINKQLADELSALASQKHVPLYTLLLAGFQTLLHRYTGQNEILVGFPKAGRSSSTVRLIGYFINQMVVRADFSADPSFVELLNAVHRFIEAGNQHDWYPFSLLVQRLQPDRDTNRSPLIQVVFSWQQAPRLIPGENSGSFILGEADQVIDLDGLSVRSVHLPYRVAPFDLTVRAAEAPDGLALTIDYATDLFTETTIARLAASYQTLLKSITTSPEEPVSALNILPPAERERLLVNWNATRAPYPSQYCLHQIFEQQAERTPELMAVASGSKQLTYRQLNLQVNRLAHFLKDQGIGPGNLVGVYLEPCAGMIQAVLGILKAGGAYLPLDPNLPIERLAYMLEDAHPDMLITCQALCKRLPDFSGATFIIDDGEDKLGPQPQNNPDRFASPDQPAYIIYTSGSTGQPKGAILAHRGVVNLLADFERRQAIQPGEACSWWTSPCFDVSVYEIFSPLLAGGCLQVIPEQMRLDASRLFDWLHEHHISSAYLPPFLLDDFAAWVQRNPGRCHLRRLLVGVEPIPDALLTGLIEQIPGLCVLNGYGPTETTICSTLYTVDAANPRLGNTPIGRPVANSHIYLLDPRLAPVPVGVVGEVYIGGVGLAHGYLNQPDLTSQRFIQSPFQSGERLYRTGDLARYLPDGNLLFVGRADTQIKLHGLRIELGEIEANLVQYPGVKQAVVLLHEQGAGGKQLMAYVTASHDPPPSPEELREYLSQRLPVPMIPSSFTVVDAFPLTTNGKVNRKDLPAPTIQQVKQRSVSLEPQTNIEKTLASILQEVLGVKRVGRDDNFFELGGDSILSLQIVALAAEAGLRLKPQHVFQAPTIARLATLARPVEAEQFPPLSASKTGMIPLAPIQQWFFQQGFPNPNHWNQSLVFIPHRPLDPALLRMAVSALLQHHDALRLCFENGGGGWQQALSDSREQDPVEIIDLSGLPRTLQDAAIDEQVAIQQGSLDLSKGLLMRVVYFHLGDNLPGRLLIAMHHLVVDGVSWRIILHDLQRVYLQLEKGQPVQLPPKTTAFHTWTQRLAVYSRSADLTRETGFWQQMIENCKETITPNSLFPDQISDQKNMEGSACRVSVSLTHAETQALLHEAQVAYKTETVDLLLTALVRAFQCVTRSNAHWIDLEAHGREDIFDDVDLSRTIGWFTSLYPIHLELPVNASLDQSIKSIMEQLHRIPNHGLGYGLLRYHSRDLEQGDAFMDLPNAPVSFNYLGQVSVESNGIFQAGYPLQTIGHQRDPNAQRPHLIEINAAVYHGELCVDWSYSHHIHSRQTIEQVAGSFIDELRQLIDYCRSAQVVGYTPSDFPAAALSQTELDTIVQMDSTTTNTVSRSNIEAIYPLSPMQQGMVFHTHYTPGSGIYIVQTAFRIQGQLDVPAFEKSWQRVLGRHTILRTSFVWQGLNQMLQVVHEHIKAPLLLEDWRELSATEQQDRFERLVAEERQCGFDLSVPPLFRLYVLQTSDDTYTILFNHHHALLDGWSVSLLFEQVFAIYDDFTHDQDLPISPARPYQDYINWLQTKDLTSARAFWHRELDGFVPSGLNSRATSPSPPAGASQPIEQEERLPQNTTVALQAMARKHHLTLSTLFQGAWAILLSHFLQRGDVIFGVTVSGRSPELPGCLAMIGLLINTLPLRVRLEPQARLPDWLQYIQSKAMDIQQFDFSPLTQIQAWSGLSPGSPLFETLLVFENYPSQVSIQGQYRSLTISNIRSIEQTTYPLTVAIIPDQQLKMRILYDPAIYAPETIHGLLNQLRDTLESMIANPYQSLAELSEGIQLEINGIIEVQSESNQGVPAQTGRTKTYIQTTDRVQTKDTASRDQIKLPADRALEIYLTKQWQEVLNIDQLDIDDNFFQMGGDSLRGAVCTYKLQNAMREQIPIAAIF